ncbi:MAG: prolyl oligopeptidase family serine peptidase [Pseudomonadota bacterium]
MTRPDYPSTRRGDWQDELAGVRFDDPYRWLEEETEEVVHWQRQQAALAAGTVRDWPHFQALRQSVERLNTPRFSSVPIFAGTRWFRLHMPAGRTQAVILISDTPVGTGQVLFDPDEISSNHPPFIAWISPSPDGGVLAIGLCADGSEHNTIRLIDVETRKELPDPPAQPLMDNWTGGAQWLADSSAFYFTGLVGAEKDFRQCIFRYDLADRSVHVPDIPLIDAGQDYLAARPASDGRWVVALQRVMEPVPVAVLDMEAERPQWRPFVTEVDGAIAGDVVGDHYVAVTDIGAPRGRIVAIPLATETPNDPASWVELVPESDAAIRSVRRVADHLYVSEFLDTYARVRVFTHDGRPLGEVPLPGRGAIAEPYTPLTAICGPSGQTAFTFGFSSLTESWGTYLHRSEARELETLIPPAVVLGDAIVEDRWARSSDGTLIPYHVVRRADAEPDRPRSALLWGYGGYNIALSPQFPGATAAIVAAGGLYVHCHLRGGSEFGRNWWEGGRLKNKQNGYQDLYAIAEDLIARGASVPDRMAVAGGSNGGLMAGVAAVQRPDLWRACVARVPALDLIADCRDAYGRSTTAMEYADPDDPDEVRRMALFSPYQLIEPDSIYPAVYVDAGANDPRCAPWHARKFVARLQAAQAGDAPVLVHIWENVGHGSATAKDVQIEQNCEWLGFVMQQLALTP